MTPVFKTYSQPSAGNGGPVRSDTTQRSIAADAGPQKGSTTRVPQGPINTGIQPSRRLHRKRAAEYLGLSVSWLDKARLRGDGPVFLQIGSRVIYDEDDLDRFLAECRRRSTSEIP